MTVVVVLAQLIKNYLDYRIGCRMETNLALLGHLDSELAKVGLNLNRALDQVSGQDSDDGQKYLLNLQDEVDLLRGRLQTHELGGRGSLASEEAVLDSGALGRIMEVDRDLYRRTDSLFRSTQDLNGLLAELPSEDLSEVALRLRGELQAVNEGLGRRRSALRGLSIG
jgi:hypothetical protein